VTIHPRLCAIDYPDETMPPEEVARERYDRALHVEMETADDCVGSFDVLHRPTGRVVESDTIWDEDPDAETVSVSFSSDLPVHAFPDMDGDEWRDMEDERGAARAYYTDLFAELASMREPMPAHSQI